MANDQDNLLDFLNKFINMSSDFVEDLEKLIKDINSHQNRCQAVKKVGTTVSVTGATCLVSGLIAAPFTAGGSLLLAGYGAVVGSIGGATNLTTEIVDFFWSKSVFKKKAQSITEMQNKLIGELNQHLEAIQKLTTSLIECGIEEKTAVVLAVFNVANKGRSIFLKARDIASIAQTIKTGYLIQGGNIGYFLAARGIKSLDGFGSIAFTLSKWGIKISKGAVQTVMNGVTVVFAVWDLVSLINGWDKKHPSSVQVTQLKEHIEKNLENIRKLRDSLQCMKY